MLRKAFIMRLKPGNEAEYVRRHNPIWQELQVILKTQGVHNYSIYFDRDTNKLFGYVEIEDEEKWAAIATTEVCQRWWAHMKELMHTNEDNSPVAIALEEVFHLD